MVLEEANTWCQVICESSSHHETHYSTLQVNQKKIAIQIACYHSSDRAIPYQVYIPIHVSMDSLIRNLVIHRSCSKTSIFPKATRVAVQSDVS